MGRSAPMFPFCRLGPKEGVRPARPHRNHSDGGPGRRRLGAGVRLRLEPDLGGSLSQHRLCKCGIHRGIYSPAASGVSAMPGGRPVNPCTWCGPGDPRPASGKASAKRRPSIQDLLTTRGGSDVRNPERRTLEMTLGDRLYAAEG